MSKILKTVNKTCQDLCNADLGQISYKGYKTKVYYSEEDYVYHGKIEDIDDLVTWECDCLGEVKSSFYSSVEDYLEQKQNLI